jgi:hypothetical protein
MMPDLRMPVTLNPSMHRSIWPYTVYEGQLDPRTGASTNVSKYRVSEKLRPVGANMPP